MTAAQQPGPPELRAEPNTSCFIHKDEFAYDDATALARISQLRDLKIRGRSGEGLRPARPSTVVAIPACDETDRIEQCLQALSLQRNFCGVPLPTGSISIIVLANNCKDNTAEVARRFKPGIRVLEVQFPSHLAHAGSARRAAMEAAAASIPVGQEGLICTTDADSRPRADWIAWLWRAIDDGAEAVAGAVDFDPRELGTINFSAARRQEAFYTALQAELIARADPEAHNPWPNHIWAWGANLAVTASAYRKVGGLPAVSIAEDRAFLDLLRRHDVPIRHCLEARVWTSARTRGRAEEGLASLVRDHVGLDATPCDALLQPARLVWRRALKRRLVREAYVGIKDRQRVAARLHVAPLSFANAMAADTFGVAWTLIEEASQSPPAVRLQVADLPREIARALVILKRGSNSETAAQRLQAASAGLWGSGAEQSANVLLDLID